LFFLRIGAAGILKKIDRMNEKIFVQSNMEPRALLTGLVVSLMAYSINRKVSGKKTGQFSIWNGWVAALSVRFFGIIFSAFYLLIATVVFKESINESAFMLNVLIMVMAGMIVDFVSSLSIVRAVVRVEVSRADKRADH